MVFSRKKTRHEINQERFVLNFVKIKMENVECYKNDEHFFYLMLLTS